MSQNFFIGIDEAGLGPTLGPMVHGWCGIESPHKDLQIVMKEVEQLCQAARIQPKDSKKLFSGSNKTAKLNSCFTGILSLLHASPRKMKDLNLKLPLNEFADQDLYPAYLSIDQFALPAYEVNTQNNLFGGVCTLLEGELNTCLARGFNKSSTALLKIGKIIDLTLGERKNEQITFLIDKQGGRNFYQDFLSDIFPFKSIQIIKEGNELSQYAVEIEGRKVSFYFAMKGDSKYLLISIASILAKWTRELYMDSFNSFWNRYNSVEYTAGYPQDAKRFIAEMSGYFEKSGIPLDLIIRRK